MENESQKNYQSIIIEIRAGTGGDEAALFAAALFRMYSKYGQSLGWRQKILDSHPSELGGYKQIVFELAGENIWPRIKNEGGVHRVQRIPETEKRGRIHTSTATVAVLPKLDPSQRVKINPQDLSIDTYRASGPGGQYVNRRETAVRVIHLPTGTAATSQAQRSQAQNREKALEILEAKLFQQQELEKLKKIGQTRRRQIATAERAEKIRTYNFPQNRLTDHRINKSWHNLDQIMEGKLEKVIGALSEIVS